MKSINLTTTRRIAGQFIMVTPNQLRKIADAAEESLKHEPNSAVEISDGTILYFEKDWGMSTASGFHSLPHDGNGDSSL